MMEKARHAYLRLLTMLKLVTMLSLAVLPFSSAAGMTHVAPHAAMQMHEAIQKHAAMQTDASVDISASALSEHCPSVEGGKTKPVGDNGKADKKDCCKTFCASVAVLADAGEARFGLPRSALSFGLQPQFIPGERAGLHRPPRS